MVISTPLYYTHLTSVPYSSYFRGIDQIVSMSAPAKCKAMEVCMRLLADHEKITTQEAYIEGFMSDSMGEP